MDLLTPSASMDDGGRAPHQKHRIWALIDAEIAGMDTPPASPLKRPVVAPDTPDAKPATSTFEITKDGQAMVKVYDSPALRAAFLHYAGSSIKPEEMHRLYGVDGAQINMQQFCAMCKELKMLEPDGEWVTAGKAGGRNTLEFAADHAHAHASGPVDPITLGIMYASLVGDQLDGLSYQLFLDSLMELSFECHRNVAEQLEEAHAHRLLEARPPVSMTEPSRANVLCFVLHCSFPFLTHPLPTHPSA
jgi:hypothetical protein